MRQRKCVSIIWHVPFPRDEGEIMTVAKRILKKVEEKLPIYQTREMTTVCSAN